MKKINSHFLKAIAFFTIIAFLQSCNNVTPDLNDATPPNIDIPNVTFAISGKTYKPVFYSDRNEWIVEIKNLRSNDFRNHDSLLILAKSEDLESGIKEMHLNCVLKYYCGTCNVENNSFYKRGDYTFSRADETGGINTTGLVSVRFSPTVELDNACSIPLINTQFCPLNNFSYNSGTAIGYVDVVAINGSNRSNRSVTKKIILVSAH